MYFSGNVLIGDCLVEDRELSFVSQHVPPSMSSGPIITQIEDSHQQSYSAEIGNSNHSGFPDQAVLWSAVQPAALHDNGQNGDASQPCHTPVSYFDSTPSASKQQVDVSSTEMFAQPEALDVQQSSEQLK